MKNSTTPRDFFLHLGATIALYASGISLLNLLFTIINFSFPDRLAGYYYSGNLVWPISMLIVLVPILYVIEWYIAKDLKEMPEKKDIWIRRWRIYLTLFLTGATIAGDVIALLNTYFNGEITARFIWKIVAVLIVCAAIFKFYLYSRWSDKNKKYFIYTKLIAGFGIILVIGSIVAGFVIVGSPAKQRSLRFDQQRISNLMNIQGQVVNYWQRNNKVLPTNLAALRDDISGYEAPVDPRTDAAYEYTPTGSNTFKICATFELDSDELEKGRYRGSYGGYDYVMSYPGDSKMGNFDHEAGKTCFDRTIDPTIYPPTTPVPEKPLPL